MEATAHGMADERFWRRVDRSGECWTWTGSRNACGYGTLRRERRTYLAHRWSWLLAGRELPVGLSVCHRCDTPACVNPDHLFLGTHQENIADMVQKNRHVRGARKPAAKLVDDDVRAIREMARQGEKNPKIAALFGVSTPTIWHIVRRRQWRHVA